eukprot:280598-Rhodomonas_salina.1
MPLRTRYAKSGTDIGRFSSWTLARAGTGRPGQSFEGGAEGHDHPGEVSAVLYAADESVTEIATEAENGPDQDAPEDAWERAEEAWAELTAMGLVEGQLSLAGPGPEEGHLS